MRKDYDQTFHGRYGFKSPGTNFRRLEHTTTLVACLTAYLMYSLFRPIISLLSERNTEWQPHQNTTVYPEDYFNSLFEQNHGTPIYLSKMVKVLPSVTSANSSAK